MNSANYQPSSIGITATGGNGGGPGAVSIYGGGGGGGNFAPGQMLTASALNAALSSVGAALTKSELQSEMNFGEDSFIKFTAPPPNWLRRLIWRVALGVVWKDLRPERALEELAKLK